MTSKQKSGSEAIGRRLRAIRHGMSATLADVSLRTGVSISALSKIENGQISASYDVLKRICDGLDIGLEDLVSAGGTTTLSGRKTTTRHGQGEQFRSDQYDYRVHASEISRKGMVPLEMLVRARSPEEFDHWSQHRGEEFVYVLAGSIEVHTEHYAPFRLDMGESAYFDSSMRHLYISVSEADARVLSVSHDSGMAEQKSIARFMNPNTRALDSADLVS